MHFPNPHSRSLAAAYFSLSGKRALAVGLVGRLLLNQFAEPVAEVLRVIVADISVIGDPKGEADGSTDTLEALTIAEN